jgi:hypothetical protein
MIKHGKWNEGEHQYLLQLRKEYPKANNQFYADKLTDKYDVLFTPDGVRHYIARNVKEVVKAPLGYKETHEINKDGSHTSDKLVEMSQEQSKSVEYLLKAHGFDVNEWELVTARNNIWNTNNKIKGIEVLYSSRITVKPKKEEFSVSDIKEFFADLTKHYQSPRHKPIRYSEDGKMLELHIDDLHLGKLCWVEETNDRYDENIAQERFFYIINDVLSRTADYKFEKILFIWSNDFFHFDGLNKATTGGTPQDTNLQYQRMFKLGVKMLTEAIDLLSQFAPVQTMYVGANHDKVTSYFATEYLYAWFRNNANVTVDNSPRARKYVEYGKCLLQLSHGHSEKKRLGQTMQIDMREAWGRTVYHEVHAAHIHSSKMYTEENGVIVRHLSSPTGTDRWHDDSGYIGAVKKAEHFVWDREKGLEMIIHTPII